MKEKYQNITIVFLFVLVLALFFPIYLVEKQLGTKLPEIFVEQPFVGADIVIDVDRPLGEITELWRALAQGGEEPGVRMLEPTVRFTSRLKTKYIRLDHIFDDAFYQVVRGRNGDGTLQLDWSKLDLTVDDILNSGAKPFFSLSYMPGIVSSSLIGKPNDWGDWQTLVRELIRHYSAKIDGVYYEVWNEPSLSLFGDWKMYGDKDYRLLYYYSVLGGSQAKGVKPFKIGGPAIPELDPRWISLLFDYVLERNLRLDFISWHRYNFDPERFLKDVEEIDIITADPKYSQFKNIEKIITEWGPNSYKDKVYSSSVAASHAVTTLRYLLDKVSLAFAFEIKDGPSQELSGWGILTHEKEPTGVKEKPRFLLYDWLADVKGTRLSLEGEGSQIRGFAVKEDRTITVILGNYTAFGSNPESFSLTLKGLPPGKYRLFRQVLFQRQNEQELDVTHDAVALTLNLPAYSVVRIRLTLIEPFPQEVVQEEPSVQEEEPQGFQKIMEE